MSLFDFCVGMAVQRTLSQSDAGPSAPPTEQERRAHRGATIFHQYLALFALTFTLTAWTFTGSAWGLYWRFNLARVADLLHLDSVRLVTAGHSLTGSEFVEHFRVAYHHAFPYTTASAVLIGVGFVLALVRVRAKKAAAVAPVGAQAEPPAPVRFD